jgi:glycosyltransferase involved in cell wall biosynthesis
MKMKLMIVIWNMGIGGIQKRMRDVILDISENHKEWEIYLLIKLKSKSTFVKEISRIDSVHIDYMTDSHDDTKTFRSVFWIAKKYLEIKPDVCLTFLDYLSTIMVWLRRIFFWQKTKIILNEGILTSIYIKLYRGKWSRFWWEAVKYSYGWADKIIVPTIACKDDLIQNFGISMGKIIVIPNWTLFKPVDGKKKMYDLINVGRMEKEKNLTDLLKAVLLLVKKFKNLKVCFVGEGSQKSALIRATEVMGLKKHVCFVGERSQAEVIDYLRRSKIFVLPTKNEGLPNVVLEAGMCQVPTVSYPFEGWGEVIIDGKTGLIANGIETFAAKCQDLLENDDLRRKMGLAVQERMISKFSTLNQDRYINVLLSNNEN